jgi:hypothetical protein
VRYFSWSAAKLPSNRLASTPPSASASPSPPSGARWCVFAAGGDATSTSFPRAVGYNYEAVKIFMPANREKPVIVPYIEHVPPDVTAGIFG